MKEKFIRYIPIKTVSEANRHEHWRVRHARSQLQKAMVSELIDYDEKLGDVEIILTRCGRRSLDSDNLPTSLKYIRDAIADKLIPGLAPGRADNDPRLTWIYKQRKAKDPGVLVQIEPRSQCFSIVD
jgi:hypothetical protein